jgi:hypothetical protein
MPLVCPVCDSNDKIAKASAIVAEGSASGFPKYPNQYGIGVPSTMTTDLARRLGRPSHPDTVYARA